MADVKDFIIEPVILEYKGKKIQFYPPSGEDSYRFFTKIETSTVKDIIASDLFFEILSKSTNIPIETVKKFSPGLLMMCYDKLLEVMDIDFFILGARGIMNKLNTLQERKDTQNLQEQLNTLQKEAGQSNTS